MPTTPSRQPTAAPQVTTQAPGSSAATTPAPPSVNPAIATRVAMAGFTLGGAGVVSAAVDPALVVTVGAVVGCLLGVVGTAQLGVQLRRALAD